MKTRIAITMALVSILLSQTLAQDKAELDRLDEKFTRYFEKAMPGWKHERVDPMVPTENVLIQFWSASERKVKISIIPYRSANEARIALENFMKFERTKEPLTDYGDEAYARGYGSADVAFRKGRLGIFVSTTAEIGARPEERMLNQSQRFELMKSEMRKWSREFAKHAASAMDSP
jgi:hypothetical protein